MEIPVCGRRAWSSVEEYSGGSRTYQLRAAGWTLVDSSLELMETNYSCAGRAYDLSDDDELWELLVDIDTAFEDGTPADPPHEDVSLVLWEVRPTPV